MTPGVSMLRELLIEQHHVSGSRWGDVRLAFEVLHDIQKLIVHVRLMLKPNLDLVQVAQGILRFH